MSLHCIVWCCRVLYCWLRRAGCISQDTYLLYLLIKCNCIYYLSGCGNRSWHEKTDKQRRRGNLTTDATRFERSWQKLNMNLHTTRSHILIQIWPNCEQQFNPNWRTNWCKVDEISEAKLCRSFPEKFANIKFAEGVPRKTIQLPKFQLKSPLHIPRLITKSS